MLILLPSVRSNVQQLSRDLMHVSMTSILSEMTSQEVFVQIPRFKISYKQDLTNVLKKLDMYNMFSKSANFSNLLDSNSTTTLVSHIFHSAKIEVSEKGTVAAAASGKICKIIINKCL